MLGEKGLKVICQLKVSYNNVWWSDVKQTKHCKSERILIVRGKYNNNLSVKVSKAKTNIFIWKVAERDIGFQMKESKWNNLNLLICKLKDTVSWATINLLIRQKRKQTIQFGIE